MTVFLENVYDALTLDEITEEEALYLIYTHSNIDYPISAKALLKLTKLKFIVGSNIGKVLYSSSVSISSDTVLTGTIKPIYSNSISKEVVIKIARLLCVIDPKSGLPKLPGVTGTDSEMQYTAKHFLQGEGLLAFHFITFLYLFPVQGKSNRKWEKHFLGFEYKGVRIRLRSKSTGGKFLKIAKKHDMGAFLYGTYLYIQSTIVDNKSYVKTILNYLKEYEGWYAEALELIKDAKTMDELFTKKEMVKEGRTRISL